MRLGRIDQRLGEADLILARKAHDLGVLDDAPGVLASGSDEIAGQRHAAQASGALHLVIDLDRDTRFQSGGLGFNLSGVNASIFTPELGVTADANYEITSMIRIKPLVGIAVVFQDKPDVITAQFQGGGNPFLVKSPLSSNAAFRPEAGVDVKIGQSVSFQLGYQGTLGGGIDSNGGYAGLRMDW